MEKKLEYKCANCGTTILKPKSLVKRSKTGNIFCSRSCAASYNNSHFRTGENNPNWIDGNRKGMRYARLAFRAYSNKCAICGLDEKCCLQVHHIDKDRKNDSIENLIILCANCHLRVHSGKVILTEEILNNREMI